MKNEEFETLINSIKECRNLNCTARIFEFVEAIKYKLTADQLTMATVEIERKNLEFIGSGLLMNRTN